MSGENSTAVEFEIVESPIRFRLHGVRGSVEDKRYAEIGMRLMDQLWPAVKQASIATTGINHWVYLSDAEMFAGLELSNPEQAPAGLELLAFELPRYLKHIHVGPYQGLPEKWRALKAELAARGEVMGAPSLEVYGHHDADPDNLETTILIGLRDAREKQSATIDRTMFQSIYAGQPRWEIGRPQKALLDVADRVTGSILDSGCGTGENALFFASRGQPVTGIDFLEEPVPLAKQKAAERGLAATFLVMDALTLGDLPQLFDSVVDSGLFHVFSDDDRRRYVDGLAAVLKPGGRLFLLCFSDAEPGDQGPRRVSQKELHDTFVRGWIVETIEPSRYEVRPDPNDVSFSEGGPKAWLVIARKTG